MTGCTTTPPSNTENLCSIFQEKDSWYVDAHDVHRKYGVPIMKVGQVTERKPIKARIG